MSVRIRDAFTLIELVFVLVVIGILSAVAIPRLAATRDDAHIAKARATLSAVRNAIISEHQKRILRGDFAPITSVNAGGGMFDTFSADSNGVSSRVLEYPPQPCSVGDRSCWSSGTDNNGNTTYTYTLPDGNSVTFVLQNNRLVCAGASCSPLE